LPADVGLVEEYLAKLWQIKPQDVRGKIKENFMRIVRPLLSGQK
jgi:hypothetical protein